MYKHSPSLHEDKLHKAILSAINEYYDCGDNIKELLKSNIEQALAGVSIKETKEIQRRLREIDDARNDYITLIASGTTVTRKMQAFSEHILYHAASFGLHEDITLAYIERICTESLKSCCRFK